MLKNIISRRDYFIPKLIFLFITFSLIHFGLGYRLKLIYVIGITVLMLSINKYRYLYLFFVYLFSIISAFYLPIGVFYGQPSLNMISSLFYTNEAESYEFLSSIPMFSIIGVISILFFGFQSAKFKFQINKKFSLLFFTAFLVIFLHAPVKNYIEEGYFNLADSGYPEISFMKDLIKSVNTLKEQKILYSNLISKKDDFRNVTSNSKYDTYVVIIGESARRDFLNFYGFHINNTPFMNSVNGIFFTNYTSASGATLISLINTLSLNKHLENNIVALAKKGGFKTYWLSNQGSLGDSDTPIASIGKKADTYFFPKKFDYTANKKGGDLNLLKPLKHAIEEKYQKKLIVLHLMGSHPPFCIRTNNRYDAYFESKELSCYVKSIRDTDDLLATIHKYLTQSNSKWSMMYFSDHGLSRSEKERLNKTTLLHNDKYRQNFEVPFFVTSYDSYKKDYITEKRSAFNFMLLFSQWTGIHEKKIDSDCQMLSNEFCEKQSFIIDFNNNVVDYSNLPSEVVY
ncbi:phosphoethanolamine transferase [Arsenophonus nasoniae]|uniref:phosphoethanolamine transferase n=1 Tax=Arsenophonus nasoniae TaxID=638 RepID=UPI00387A6859